MDVTSKQKKKIVKYIIDDRFKKLSKYLDREEISLNAIINKKGEKMLHICCREGSTDCLEYLIEKGAKVNLVDKEGNLPIHLAIEYTIDHYTSSLEQKLVSTLLTYCSGQVNRQNFKGVSVKDLLDRLNQLKSPKRSSPKSPIDISSDSDDREYSDQKWREKLQYECDYEFESQQGRYEDEDDRYYNFGGGGGRESYDDWADRIYAAFSARQKKIYGNNYSERKAKEPQSTHKENLRQKPADTSQQSRENLEKLCAARKLKKMQEMYVKLFSSSEEVSLNDIPFDGMKPAEIIDLMLQSTKGKDSDTVKKAIREELRRWHPDKFKQKIGSRVQSGQIHLVMEKVKTIAQALTTFGQ